MTPIESRITRALEGYNSATNHKDQALSLLLVGWLITQAPVTIDQLPGSRSLLGLALAAEHAQWNTMFDLANTTYNAELKDIREWLGKSENEKVDHADLWKLSGADEERPKHEKVLWSDMKYSTFVREYFDTVEPVYAKKSAKLLAKHINQANDPLLADLVFGEFGTALVKAINRSAFLRIYLFMHQGLFDSELSHYLTKDRSKLVKRSLIKHMSDKVYPIIDSLDHPLTDPINQFRLVSWTCGVKCLDMHPIKSKKR